MTAQGWSFRMTPIRKLLILLAALCLGVSIFRLATGLGTVTNLNDDWPWGLWIGFDVLTGVALAGRRLFYRHYCPCAAPRKIPAHCSGGYVNLSAGLPAGNGRPVPGYRSMV
ncbi:exported hypothetical protein [Desulforamulus hydrothermalis Lam5 = DSM 18033]|uniref:Uncharacterized protein n=1 Tax=Desulforamulus hydrothermalis Lam5 = DSM 18033 TaxID=1121428 RepID=K8EF60_9FIRM|nr:exported hypothetical protein [Desulforamulus hydrothermalis Lam5 = DSM 18033]